MGLDQTTRHNPPTGAAILIGSCAQVKMQGLLSLNEVAVRASMSTRFIRKHLSEIPHYRASARGKIWIEWSDFRSWLKTMLVEINRDDPVVEILGDLAQTRSGSS
jgi:hypothetical protein